MSAEGAVVQGFLEVHLTVAKGNETGSTAWGLKNEVPVTPGWCRLMPIELKVESGKLQVGRAEC